MKVFIDANILVSVLNKEYPLFTRSARLLSLTDTTSFQLYTSPICFAIAFYFASKKSGEVMAKAVMKLRRDGMTIASPKSIEKTCIAIYGELQTSAPSDLKYV